MNKKYWMCVLAAVAVGGTTVQAQQYNSEPVMNEIAAIRQELEILQRQVYREQNDGISNPRSAADIAVKIGEFDEKLRRLSGQVDEANYKIRQLENKIELINKDVDVRIKMIEGKPVSGNGGAVSASAAEKFKAPVAVGAPQAVTGDSIAKGDDLAPVKTKAIQQIYDEGLEAVKISDYAVAEQRFNEILKKAPDDKLAGNAQYWLGEVFYGQKNYQKAAVAFAKVIEKYKDGPKGPDSLLKLGMSMQNLKKNTEACQAFKSMKTEFPKAEKAVLDRAANEIKKLGCK
jgi:tol-pal system protein ybgF